MQRMCSAYSLVPGGGLPLALTRRILLLMLLAAPGATGKPAEPIHGITRTEKLAFLLESLLLDKRVLRERFFGFQAYDYGPFSSEVYGDLEFFSQQSFISTEALLADPDGTVESESALKAMLDSMPQAGVDADMLPPQAGSTEPLFALTEKGKRLVADKLQPLMRSSPEARDAFATAQRLKEAFGQIPLRQLISYVYTQYPAFAEKSTIRERVPEWKAPR